MGAARTTAAVACAVMVAVAGCGGDDGGKANATARPVDPIRCLKQRGVKPTTDPADLPFADPARLVAARVYETPDGRLPFSFGPPKAAEQYRIYVVPAKGHVPSLKEVVRRPQDYPFVGYLPPPASPAAILHADDCLNGRVGDEPRIQPKN